MDSYLVSTMVQGHQPQTQSKKLHPFFSKDPLNTPDAKSVSGTPSHDGHPETSTTYDATQYEQRERRKLGGSPRSEASGTASETASAAPQMIEEPATSIPHTSIPPEDSALKTTNLGSESAEKTPTIEPAGLRTTQETVAPNPAATGDSLAKQPTNESRRPRRVLKFNMSTGTLGSPPKPKQSPKPSRIVSMKYGNKGDDAKQRIGTAITQILDGTLQLPVTPTKKKAKRSRAKKSDQQEMHGALAPSANSFFGGKPKPTPQEATRAPVKPRHTVFMTTPVSPRKSRMPFDASKAPNFGAQRTGTTKVPGAMHAMWPPKGMSHVRGDETVPTLNSLNVAEPPRKSKGQVVTVSRGESILESLARDLELSCFRSELQEEDTFPRPPPEELRLPARHFESGRKLRARIEPQLKSAGALRQNHGVDGMTDVADAACHPAITALYTALETQLSAYDRSTCESLAWSHKYAPTCATEVLQSSREGPLLKEWLEALKVQSVDTGSLSSEAKTSGKQEKAPKRRKKNKLDGFIVDSDDEADELNGISEEDDEDSSSETVPSNKTIIRNGSKDLKESGRLKNAVLISGPNGCGKTAAVYAVAKELDYEIFEINSCSRRSGKDLMEKVGDMTRNHLVQQHRAEKAAVGGSDDGDSTADDVKSGKQGQMTAFFKPKPTLLGKTKVAKRDAEKGSDSAKNSAPKAQKQSLILVEEADVLYKEDTQFWATLMSMISQSKRPFILTCNDESLVPMKSQSLHGIFRFTTPPMELAVDLCILIAANEGHALQRGAVEAAYVSRGEDLRATLMDLNYWCQLGVGDRRGGFDWFLLRWPRGCDLDENGDTVRVVSEDTYTKGMGWVGRDAIVCKDHSLHRDEEVMQQLWNLWHVPIGNWQSSLDLKPWARDISAPSLATNSKFSALAAYDDFCETMSMSDLCSNAIFGSPFQQHIDPTLPDLPIKMRDDYILGRQLLEADPVAPYACPSASISQCLASLARRSLLHRTENLCKSGAANALGPLTECAATSALNESFRTTTHHLTRYDLSLAFDPLAISDKALVNSLDPSVFDRTLRLIVLDVAPWVRGIMAYDNRLMQDRTKLSSLLSEGGNGKGRKRMRTTRSALSALEGGERRTTRGDRWFKGAGTGFVMRTGAEGWAEAARAEFEARQHAEKMGEEQARELAASEETQRGDVDMGWAA